MGLFEICPLYTPEEIEELLSSVKHSTGIEKRSYAVLMIAARLGLRADDIAALTFDCLKSNGTRLEFIQMSEPAY